MMLSVYSRSSCRRSHVRSHITVDHCQITCMRGQRVLKSTSIVKFADVNDIVPQIVMMCSGSSPQVRSHFSLLTSFLMVMFVHFLVEMLQHFMRHCKRFIAGMEEICTCLAIANKTCKIFRHNALWIR